MTRLARLDLEAGAVSQAADEQSLRAMMYRKAKVMTDKGKHRKDQKRQVSRCEQKLIAVMSRQRQK